MKIYSWNVLWSNARFDDAFEFLRTLDFDILCLQEVPSVFLERLWSLKHHTAEAVELVRHLAPGRDEVIYSVILSRHPIRSSARIAFPSFSWPLRTQTFVKFMRPWGWSKSSGRGGVYADVEIGETLVRVFSVHLSLSAPFRRAQEFAVVAEALPKRAPAIVCGDLNVIEFPFLKPLNWILGSPFKEAMPWHDERGPFEKRFSLHALANPLRGHVTHPFSRSQLDHILVSKSLTVLSAHALTERFGSDHQPIFVEITLRSGNRS
jgi:endonuclease/exonuclease/phosphatase family metal-dependent hydrolase